MSVAFTIAIPKTTPGAHSRRPMYVSTATQSAVVTYGSARQVINCVQGVCTATLGISPGTITFQVNLYDGTGGTGNVLSTGSTTAVIAVGQNNAVNITFGGVVAKVALAPASASVPVGAAVTIPVVVSALDAAGKTIVGPDPYATPITLASDDTTGATSLSTTSVVNPNTAVTLNYNGSAAISAVHLSANVAGTSMTATPVAVAFTPVGGGSAQQTSFTQLASQDGALAIYPLSDPAGVLTDAGPHGVNGVQGAAVQKSVPGIAFNAPTAIAFNGGAYDPNAFDYTQANPALQPASAATVEVWVQPSAANTSGNSEALVAYGQASPSGLGYTLQLRSPYNQIVLRVRLNGTPQYAIAYGTSHIMPGQTYHIVGTFDGSVAKVYVNGVLDSSATSVPASSISYYTPLQYGLSIGNERGSTRTQFQGTMADLAIYPTALSQSVITKHYLAGINTPTLVETPAASDAFVDSIGINTHFTFINTMWDVAFAQMQSALVSTGIRHIRDGLANVTWPTYYSRLNQLASLGIKSDLVMYPTTTAQDVVTVAARVPNALESLEGLNEPDLNGPNWQPGAIAAQQMLYQTAKSNPGTAMLPVYGPSLTSPQAALSLGNLSNYLDAGNLHNYFGQDYPGNPGFGSYNPQWGYGGSIASYLTWEAFVAGNKPVITTETGYGTDPSSAKQINYNVQAKYLTRTFLEQYAKGIHRTYTYELSDEPPQAGKNFNYFGLMDTSFNPKPSFNAIKSLIAALADPGASFSPTPLSYKLGGALNNVHHLLMQKHDGTYELAIWLEASDWNTQTNVELQPAPQSVTLQLAANPSVSNIMTIDGSGNPHTNTLPFSGGTATMNVSDQVSIVTFR